MDRRTRLARCFPEPNVPAEVTLLCFPVPPALAAGQALDRAGYSWQAVAAPEATRPTPDDGWSGAVICRRRRPDRRLRPLPAPAPTRGAPVPAAPGAIGPTRSASSSCATTSSTTSASLPVDPDELEARLPHLFWRTGRGLRPDIIEYGPLVLNLETYQAAVAGPVLDLTYMEYELLRFLAAHPGKVFTRETLLSRVWGYEYYGGARTVDVHIRRLRAKLGEEHAHLIQTVRSVGYRFGQSRWTL